MVPGQAGKGQRSASPERCRFSRAVLSDGVVGWGGALCGGARLSLPFYTGLCCLMI